MLVPNITNITYGRGVGYAFEEETFDCYSSEQCQGPAPAIPCHDFQCYLTMRNYQIGENGRPGRRS